MADNTVHEETDQDVPYSEGSTMQEYTSKAVCEERHATIETTLKELKRGQIEILKILNPRFALLEQAVEGLVEIRKARWTKGHIIITALAMLATIGMFIIAIYK